MYEFPKFYISPKDNQRFLKLSSSLVKNIVNILWKCQVFSLIVLGVMTKLLKSISKRSRLRHNLPFLHI